MSFLYTKNGRPLQRSGDNLHSRSGTHLGHVSGDKIYDTSGRYAGTIVDDRVVYRSTDSATVSGASAATANLAGTASAPMAGSAIWGEEPPFPD